MRELVINSKEITQGTIFNNTFSDDYKNENIHGIIITARCDISNRKSKKYNYLPIVPYKDWLKKEGFEILIQRVLNNKLGNIKKYFRDNKISLSLIDRIDYRDILQKNIIFKDRNKVEKYFKDYELIKNTTTICDFYKKFPKELKALNNELTKYNIAGYYFLEDIGYKTNGGYVVLLREIKSLSNDFIDELKYGIPVDIIEKYLNNPCYRQENTEIVSVLQSPYIEHLLQSFSILFSRIGINEVSEDLDLLKGVM